MNLKKPETRAELLLEAKGSFVREKQRRKWWSNDYIEQELFDEEDEDDCIPEESTQLQCPILQNEKEKEKLEKK